MSTASPSPCRCQEDEGCRLQAPIGAGGGQAVVVVWYEPTEGCIIKGSMRDACCAERQSVHIHSCVQWLRVAAWVSAAGWKCLITTISLCAESNLHSEAKRACQSF